MIISEVVKLHKKVVKFSKRFNVFQIESLFHFYFLKKDKNRPTKVSLNTILYSNLSEDKINFFLMIVSNLMMY